jgi:ABC-type transport system involved in multi-copper enzyme maturation permease subunit
MMKAVLSLIELALIALTFILVLNMTMSVISYYQQSTGSMIHMMNTLEGTLPTNYTDPYGSMPSNYQSPMGFGIYP